MKAVAWLPGSAQPTSSRSKANIDSISSAAPRHGSSFALACRPTHVAARGRPRLYGGFAFQTSGADGSLWRGFGDGRFVLPRWLYRRGARAGTLTLSVAGETLAGPAGARRRSRRARSDLGRLGPGAGRRGHRRPVRWSMRKTPIVSCGSSKASSARSPASA